MAVHERVSVPPRKPPAAAPARVTITVGIHGDDGADRHEGGDSFAEDGAVEGSGELTVAEIGAFHEFGTSTVPQRSFIRAWFDENQPFIGETLTSQMRLVMAGKLPLETAMARVALAFEGSVKQRIARGIAPPLAKATIEAKGSSKPLIDTGQLRNAIRGRARLTTQGE